MKKLAPYRFFMLMFCVFAPVVLLVSFFEGGCWLVGENKPLGLIAKEIQSSSDNSLFMRQYYDQGLYRYKYLCLKERKPKVVAIGTSRTMQFRSEMFSTKGSSFYNGGGMVQHLRDLEEFVLDIPRDTTIRTVILGIEYWWLLESFADVAENDKHFLTEIQKDDVWDGIAHASLFQNFVRGNIGLHASQYPTFRDVLEEFYSYHLHARKRFGWYARRNNSGFRRDGSFEYGQLFPENYSFQDRERVVDRIRKYEWGRTKGQGVSTTQIERLLSVLNTLHDQGIQVFCFLPPFSSEVLEALQLSEEYKKSWNEYLTILPLFLREKGFHVIDASSTLKFGFDDSCMFDGLHAMETFHVALLLEFLKSSQGKNDSLPDYQYLTNLLNRKSTSSWFPVYE